MAAPFRVCDLAGAWHTVELAPTTSEAGVKEAVAGVVRLAPGTFSLVNDRSGGSAFHASLVGDWHVVRLLLPGPPAGAGVGAAAGGADRDGLVAAIAQMGIKIDEGFLRMGSAIASLKAPSPPPRASAGATPQSSGAASPFSGKGAGKKQLVEAALASLVAAFDGASSDAIALDLSAPPLAASSVAEPLRSRLFVHRFTSDFRRDDFWLQQAGSAAAEDLLRPHALPEEVKGASCFVVLSSNHDVILAAHAYLRLEVKNADCLARQLSTIPDALSLHFDRVVVANAANAPIIVHASLAPQSPMSMRDFASIASLSWQAAICSMKAGAEEGAWDPEHGSLHELSEDAEDYIGRKLAAAVLRDQPIAPGGASPTEA